MAPADAYDELVEHVERYNAVGGAAGVLGWDQQVMMPEGGTPARSRQLSALSAVAHELQTDERVGELLDELDGADLDADQAAVVREVRRNYERETRVPEDLVEELTRTQSEAQQVWEGAKADADFEAFAPTLERIVDLHTERAGHVDPDAAPYEVMHEDGSPYLPISRIEEIFTSLREGLVPLIDAIADSDADLATDAFAGTFDEDEQMALSEAALDLLGYDFERGRLDTSPHPFTSGNQFDARVTTRVHEDAPLDALTATIHEFGHATYALGLPDEHYGTPLGQARSHGVHESQSRFWENHVGRTREFWELFLPTVKEHFPQVGDVTVDEAYEAVNQVYDDNRIRVEADELTYHMHIILRFEVEREFVEGDLAVADVPEAWNDKMESYLGVRPDDDAEGCLQDIHWTGGFANFQNYTVGSVLAAQLWATIEDEVSDPRGLIRDGEFDPIHDWLTENVHRHGQRYRTDELVERATGEPLTADYFLEYVEEKYGELYGL